MQIIKIFTFQLKRKFYIHLLTKIKVMLKKSLNSLFTKSTLVLVLLLVMSLSSCKTKETKAVTIGSVDVKDVTFLKDSKGLPIAVKLVSNVILQGNEGTEISYSCKLRYSDELIGNGIDLKAKLEKKETAEEVTLLTPTQGKLVISRWKMCCDLKTEKDFNSITQTTVCST